MSETEQVASASSKPKEIKKEKPGFFSFDNLRSLAVLIVIIFALRWSVASPYHVPTASMEPTIKVGDRLLAFKLAYNLKVPFTDIVVAEWGKPKRGDIIVFRYPEDPDIDYVKRVVAIGGDRIEIKDDILHINGEPQAIIDHNFDRSVLSDIDDNKEIKLLYQETLSGVKHWVMQNIPSARRFTSSRWPPDGSDPYIVPEEGVFVVGDNRDNSTDSRRWNHVPLNYIRGKALFVIWSVYTPRASSFPDFRFGRFGEWLI
jgi:signal peptidase I